MDFIRDSPTYHLGWMAHQLVIFLWLKQCTYWLWKFLLDLKNVQEEIISQYREIQRSILQSAWSRNLVVNDNDTHITVFILFFLSSTFKEILLSNLKNYYHDTHKPNATAVFKLSYCFHIHNPFAEAFYSLQVWSCFWYSGLVIQPWSCFYTFNINKWGFTWHFQLVYTVKRLSIRHIQKHLKGI